MDLAHAPPPAAADLAHAPLADLVTQPIPDAVEETPAEDATEEQP